MRLTAMLSALLATTAAVQDEPFYSERWCDARGGEAEYRLESGHRLCSRLPGSAVEHRPYGGRRDPEVRGQTSVCPVAALVQPPDLARLFACQSRMRRAPLGHSIQPSIAGWRVVHSIFDAHANLQSRIKPICGHARSAGYACYAHFLALPKDSNGAASIEPLHFLGRPTAVGRLIVTATVNSVNAMFLRWATPHIFGKSLKAITPALTDPDTPGTIVTVVLRFWAVAPSDHGVPDTIERVKFPAILPSSRGPVAATANGRSRAQSRTSNHLLCTTRTDASPVVFFLAAWKFPTVRVTYNSQAPKNIASQIVWLAIARHNSNLLFGIIPESLCCRDGIGHRTINRCASVNRALAIIHEYRLPIRVWVVEVRDE